MHYLIVGFGNIGHKRLAILGDKCIGTVDPDPKVKADFKDSSLIPQDLLTKFDAVVIAVPRQPKLDLVKYWLNQGKNVLVEKPLVINLQQAYELSKIAAKKKVIWYTAYNHRFEPNIVKIKKILENGDLGILYHAQMIYGFGNVREIMHTWRETGYGVLDEIGCHLIDLTNYFFNYKSNQFIPWFFQKTEAKVFDHCVFTTSDKKVRLTASAIYWKNLFSIDIYAEKGSLHMNGLCKWGKSELIIRKRVLPTGTPKEKVSVVEQADPTWKKDIKNFELRILQKITSDENDLKTSQSLANIASQIDKTNRDVYKTLRGLP